MLEGSVENYFGPATALLTMIRSASREEVKISSRTARRRRSQSVERAPLF